MLRMWAVGGLWVMADMMYSKKGGNVYLHVKLADVGTVFFI